MTSRTWQNYQGTNPDFIDEITGEFDTSMCRDAYPGCGCDGDSSDDYGLSFDLRVTILVICYVNQLVMLGFNTLVIEGPVRLWCIANKFPIKRLEFGL